MEIYYDYESSGWVVSSEPNIIPVLQVNQGIPLTYTQIQNSSEVRSNDKPKRLFVFGLPDGFKGPDVRALFQPFGDVIKVEIIFHDEAKQHCKGYGFVTIANCADAERARQHLHGTIIEGRTIGVRNAREREIRQNQGPPAEPNGFHGSSESLGYPLPYGDGGTSITDLACQYSINCLNTAGLSEYLSFYDPGQTSPPATATAIAEPQLQVIYPVVYAAASTIQPGFIPEYTYANGFGYGYGNEIPQVYPPQTQDIDINLMMNYGEQVYFNGYNQFAFEPY